jgi:hypothetical protein
MKHLLIALVLLVASAGALQAQKADTSKVQCAGITKSGARCSRMVSKAIGYCFQHNPGAHRCAGTTKQGKPCQLLVKDGETYCRYHKNQHN